MKWMVSNRREAAASTVVASARAQHSEESYFQKKKRKNQPGLLLRISTVVPPHHFCRVHLYLTWWECFTEEENSAQHEIAELWMLLHETVFSKTLDWRRYYQYPLWGTDNLISPFENAKAISHVFVHCEIYPKGPARVTPFTGSRCKFFL